MGTTSRKNLESGATMTEKVNHPSHYKRPGRKECIIEMEDRYGTGYVAIFCLMSAYKYLYRAGEKDGEAAEDDIAKAKWYIDYVENLAAPIVDMNFWSLRVDVNRMLNVYYRMKKKEERENAKS